jgi:hypothetical protein
LKGRKENNKGKRRAVKDRREYFKGQRTIEDDSRRYLKKTGKGRKGQKIS